MVQNDNKLGFEADRYKCIIIGLIIFDASISHEQGSTRGRLQFAEL